jgi:nitrogen regulatory protein PII
MTDDSKEDVCMFAPLENISIVTAVIPQQSAARVLALIFKTYGYSSFQFDARGTVAKDRWYQAFVPMVNPEKEYLQFIVEDHNVDNFIAYVAEIAQLHIPDSGAIFSNRCENFTSNSERFHSVSIASLDVAPVPAIHAKISAKENLSAIFAVVQSGRIENAIRAAMQVGSHGPIVYYAEGRGTRDKIAWLKITKKPYEEVMMVLADAVDKDAIVQAVVSAGRVNVRGGGILYEYPLEKAIVNLPTLMGKRNELASARQMVAAIDELMGNTDWRNTTAMSKVVDNAVMGSSVSGQSVDDLSILGLIVPRKHTDNIMDAAIDLGAPGANVNYVKHLAGDQDVDASGFAIHHEMAFVRIVMPRHQIHIMTEQLQVFCVENNMANVAMFQHKLTRIIR